MRPYFDAGDVRLYHGDMRQVVLEEGLQADCVVTDPPYAETSLPWDRWPSGWPDVLVEATRSMWCFGSMRMFLTRRADFSAWKMSQDVVWEKHNGSGFAADRFKRVHENAVHWYRGPWAGIYHETPRVPTVAPGRKSVRLRNVARGSHFGNIGEIPYVDDGLRIVRSVISARSMHRRAIHPTEKPVEILQPLLEYSCPPAGLVLDPFAGSGSTAYAARLTGRRAVLVEADERYCEAIAVRLSQPALSEVAP